MGVLKYFITNAETIHTCSMDFFLVDPDFRGGSKMDLLLSKVESISKGGSISRITYLGKVKKKIMLKVSLIIKYHGN